MTHPKLAIFVDQPETGVFCWVLLQCTADGVTWTSIEASKKTFPNWNAALAAGNERLFQVAQERQPAVH